MNEKFKLWLTENEWVIECNLHKYNYENNKVLNEYKNLPEGFVSLLEEYNNISSKDDTTWFICGKDYLDESDDAFRWNEFELMSLEATDGDEEWKHKIQAWWKEKLPFIMSVKGGYSYYAIDLEDNEGTIIFGREPEFEDAIIVAKDFDDFIDKLVNNEIVL